MYLYVDISKIALSSLYLQPVICYGTAKSLIMCFQRHEIYIIFFWKNFYGSHTDTTVIFLLHHIHMLFYFQAKFGDG